MASSCYVTEPCCDFHLYFTAIHHSGVFRTMMLLCSLPSLWCLVIGDERRFHGSLSVLYRYVTALVQMEDQTGSLSLFSGWRISSSRGCWDPADNAVDKATEGTAVSSAGLEQLGRVVGGAVTCQCAVVNTVALLQLIHNKSFQSHLLTSIERNCLKMQFINSVLIRRNVGTYLSLYGEFGNILF